ncbi:MAG: BON domain-containing protein [Nitrospirales bacterium]|nr:BON domain-containing protein [Nitrospirales bacterium]
MATDDAANLSEGSEDFQEELNDALIAVAIKDQLARVGRKSFDAINVSVKDGMATLTGTADSLWTRQRASELSQLIRGVRGVIDRVSVGPVGAIDDKVITQHLEYLFHNDPVVDPADIYLDVKQGLVVLKGNVPSRQVKDTADNLAKMVKGVREVRNALTVRATQRRTDSAMREDIVRRLAFDVWVERPMNLAVEVRQGKAMLNGIVGNAFEKNRVEHLAWVKGIREVDVRGITVQWTSPDPMIRSHRPETSDRVLAEIIEQVLADDRRVGPFGIQVAVHQGVVTLDGHVPFLSMKRAAEQDVWNVVGIRSVRNFITVRPDTVFTDDDIQDRVMTEFTRDPVLGKYTLEVSVRNGAVLLTGTVESIYERNHAENIASRARGMKSLLNQIVFTKPETGKTDWEIQLDIENQVWWSPFLSGQDIVATVKDGKAILTGSVDHGHQRVIAEQQAYEAGASEVVNRLQVEEIVP